MNKINLTIGKIAMWVSGILLLFGVFGDWYAIEDEGMTIWTLWDMGESAEQIGFESGFILGILTVLIAIVFVAVVAFDFVGEKKLTKFGALGVGGASILAFIIGLASKPAVEFGGKTVFEADMGYGLILLLIGGIVFALSTFVDEKMGASANISFNTGAAPFSQNTQNSLNSAKKFCPGCGAEVSADAPFCSSCGNKL